MANGSCCGSSNLIKEKSDITVALAGNANVGKSTIFTQLTGVGQIIGNWPGKTVERAEGMLKYQGLKIKVIDLPGIYSFSTFSLEELISREFIAIEKPDAVINVVDATTLERNLFFTIQLLELGAPVIIALNQVDIMKKKGIFIDDNKLEQLLGVPVVPTVAVQGKGISQLTERMIKLLRNKKSPKKIKYGKEVEQGIERIELLLNKTDIPYPKRWAAIKLLEGDKHITKIVTEKNKHIADRAKGLAEKIAEIHGEPFSVIMSAERYHAAEDIARKIERVDKRNATITEKIDWLALHPVLGYFLIIGVIGGLLVWTFLIGNWMSAILTNILSLIEPFVPEVSGALQDILFNGAFTGFVAGLTLVIPYVIPFYVILAFMENSGYLGRISFMLDRGMHKFGLHGKAIIPMILGYGCNVPACFSCRIMETPKQKLVAAFLVTLIPCTARTLVIMGLVANFLGIWWALALYALDIILIILLGRIAFKAVPGESLGLIMEMPEYHMPSLKIVLNQTWVRTKSLIFIVFPTYIIGSALLQAFYSIGWLTPLNNALSPITVLWLGLPAVTGILLIFGIVRKELTLLMLAVIFQTTDFSKIMSPVQLIVLAFVSMIYIPCLATIFALAKEFGWKKASIITAIEVGLAIFLGGLVYRGLSLFM